MPEFLQQPESRFTVEKTGLAKLALVFKSGSGTTLDELYSFVPPNVPALVEEVSRDAQLESDGDWRLTINYAGGSEDRFKEEVSLDAAGAEDPVETHPDFKALARKYKATFDPMDRAKFTGWEREIVLPGGKEKVKNPVYGFTHFLNDGAVLTLTFNLKTYEPRFMRNLCMIDRPKIKNTKLAAMAEAPDGKNWLKKSVRVSSQGSCFQYSITWLLSGRGGWVPDVYAPRPSSGSLSLGSL